MPTLSAPNPPVAAGAAPSDPATPRHGGTRAAQVPLRACQRCEKDYRPARRNQKLCRPCRLLSDLEYWNEAVVKPTECQCGSRYLRTSRNFDLCAKCAPTPWRGTCICCTRQDQELVRAEVPICIWCVKTAAKGARRYVTEALREFIGLPERSDPDVHPLYHAALKEARVASGRLGCSDAVAIARAKEAGGLGKETRDYAALITALRAL